MENMYGIDYLKNLVSQSLGGKDKPDNPYGVEGPNNNEEESSMGYGIPAESPPQIEAPAGASMGPRFQAMIQDAGMTSPTRAMGPVAAAMPYGLGSTVSGAAALAQGARNAMVRPPKGQNDFSQAGPPQDLEEAIHRLGFIESGGNYKENSKKNNSDASGKYQYLSKTWNGYGGFNTAGEAPPEVQDRRAKEDLANNIKRYGGDVTKAVIAHIYPKWANDPSKWNTPIPNNGNVTPAMYASRVLGADTVNKHMNNLMSQQSLAESGAHTTHNVALD